MVAISWQENKEKTIKVFVGELNSIFQTLLFDANLLLGQVSQSSVEEHPSSVISMSDWKHWDFFPTFPETTSEKKCASTFFHLFHHQIHIFCLTKSIWPPVSNPDAPTELFFSWTPPPQPVTSSLCYQGSGVRHSYLNSGCLS